MIATRTATDPAGFSETHRYLIECKHYARSGKSVREAPEWMVWVSPGPFIYGEGEDARVIRLERGLFVARTPVTNAEFARFVEATGYVTTAEREGGWSLQESRYVKGFGWRHPEGPGSGIKGRMDHPVVQVNWHDCVAYAEWAGVRLLTEQEWEEGGAGN